MTNLAKALYGFFSGFGLNAYVESAVPDEAELPYITYQLEAPEWSSNTTIYARLWYRATTLTEVCAKADEIAAAIGEGLTIPTDSGCVMLTHGNPFIQYMPMEGDKGTPPLRVLYMLFDLYNFTH